MPDIPNRPLGTFVRRVALLAVASLGVIGALLLGGQLLIQRAIDGHADDSRVVNVAGRQRMLSQRLAKAALAAVATTDLVERQAYLSELEETSALLERVHRGLQRGDRDLAIPANTSTTIAAAFSALDPHVERLLGATRSLIATLGRKDDGERDDRRATADLRTVLDTAPIVLGEMETVIQQILVEEPTFLRRMEAIVSAYEHDAGKHLVALKQHEAIFLVVMLAVVLFLGVAVLLPAIRDLRQTIEHREIAERVRLNRSLLDASMRERELIGKDLHDGLGQILAGIGMMIRSLALRLVALGVPEASAARRIEALVGDAIAQTRDLSRALHPVEISDGGLEAALRTLAESAQATFGVRCKVECDDAPTLPGDNAATHLYRIAQEAVTNAVKHGKASLIVIRLARSGPALSLSVTDDGLGFPQERPQAVGLGLGIMADRARLLGGKLEVCAVPDGGTTVSARFATTAGLRGQLAA